MDLFVGALSIFNLGSYLRSKFAGVPVLDRERFLSVLRTQHLGRLINHKKETDSTMNDARACLAYPRGSCPHGSVFTADLQTAGVGRKGRSWLSREGGIYMSMVYRLAPDLDPKATFSELVKLNMALGISVSRVFNKEMDDSVMLVGKLGPERAQVKWPNDVWVDGKKMSGSIVDYDGAGTAVVGLGVNVNRKFDFTKDEDGQVADLATSMAMHMGNGITLEREVVLADILAIIEDLMAQPLSAVVAQYRSLDLLKNKRIRVHHTSREQANAEDYDAVALDICEDGTLKVRREDNGQIVILSGEEVSVRPA
jgi:BirA family biotin operon repressor/biotin-[acetyl-CoA-carboxylase] ligase